MFGLKRKRKYTDENDFTDFIASFTVMSLGLFGIFILMTLYLLMWN